MKHYNLCFLGFGNVGRALARLLLAKSSELKEIYGIDWHVTGVASRRIGWLADSSGFDVQTLLSGANERASERSNTITRMAAKLPSQTLFLKQRR